MILENKDISKSCCWFSVSLDWLKRKGRFEHANIAYYPYLPANNIFLILTVKIKIFY